MVAGTCAASIVTWWSPRFRGSGIESRPRTSLTKLRHGASWIPIQQWQFQFHPKTGAFPNRTLAVLLVWGRPKPKRNKYCPTWGVQCQLRRHLSPMRSAKYEERPLNPDSTTR